MIGDASEDIGEPGLRVHVIQPCGHDEGEHDGGTVCAALGTLCEAAEAFSDSAPAAPESTETK